MWFLPLGEGDGDGPARAEVSRAVTCSRGTRAPCSAPYGGDFVVFDPTYHEVTRVQAGARPPRRPARVPPHAGGDGAHLDLPRDRRRPHVHRRRDRRPARRGDRAGGRRRDRPRAVRVAQPRARRPRRVVPDRRHAGRQRRLLPSQLDRHRRRRQPPHLGASHVGGLQGRPDAPAEVIWRLGGKKSDFAVDPAAIVRVPARRPPSSGRDDHDLRQRRGRADGQDAARAACGSRST